MKRYVVRTVDSDGAVWERDLAVPEDTITAVLIEVREVRQRQKTKTRTEFST